MSPQRRPSVGRAQSRERAAVDPVLARYHAIKREMEQQGVRSRASTPRSGTPSRGTLYGAQLTPDAAHTAPSARPVSPSAGVAARREDRLVQLERDLAEKNRRIAQLEAHQSAHTAVVQDSRDRAQDAEARARRQALLDAERNRAERLAVQSHAAAETERADDAHRRADELQRELDGALHRISELNSELSRRADDCAALAAAKTAAERKAADAAGAQQPNRILQGKVAALEDVVATRDREVMEARRAVEELQHRLEECRVVEDRLQRSAGAKEREVGEAAASIESLHREVERWRVQQRDWEVTERVLRQQANDCEEQTKAARDALEALELQHKDELRHRSKEIHARDMEIVAADERTRDAEAARLRAVGELEATRAQMLDMEKAHRDMNAKLEAMKVAGAQSSIMADEQRAEVERFRNVVEDLRAEIRSQEAARSAQDERISELEQDRKVKMALEAQLAVLQASFGRQEEDLAQLRKHHEELQRRCAQAEDRLDDIPRLQSQVSEAEALANGRALTIDKLRGVETTLRQEVDALHTKVDAERHAAEQARLDFVQEHERCGALEADVEQLEDEVAVLAEVQGKLAALNDAMDERRAQCNRLQLEVREWQNKCGSAEAEIDVLRDAREQAQRLQDERRHLLQELDSREATARQAEQHAASLSAALRSKEDQLRDAKEAELALESDNAKLAAQVAEKAQLEARLKQAQNNIAARTEEAARERQRAHELQTRLREKEEALSAERVRRSDVEQQHQHQQAEVTRLQVEIGKMSVAAESHEREKARLEKDLQHRLQQLDAKTSDVANLERSLALLEEARRELERKLQTADQEREVLLLREREAENQLAAQRKAYDDAQSQLRALQRASHDADDRLRECNALHDKLLSMEGHLRARDDDLAAANSTLQELRTKCKELTTELNTARRFEQRCSDVKAQVDKMQRVVDAYEADDAAKSQQLIEKERENGRLRERIASLTADIDTERVRRGQAEARAHELEHDSNRACQLDGQLAGVTLVAQQRARDLEDERSACQALRDRLRELERATVQKGSGASAAIIQELEHKVHVRDELVSRLESESDQRARIVEQLREEISKGENERRDMSQNLNRLRDASDRTDASWHHKYQKLESDFEEFRRGHDRDARARRLEEEIADLRHQNAQLQQELALRAQVRREPSLPRRSNSVNEALEAELRRTRDTLEHTTREKAAAEVMLHERESELAVAVENIETLQRRVPAADRRPSPGARKSRVASTPASPQVDEVQAWRERRRELALIDAERGKEYEAASRAPGTSVAL